MIPDDTWRWRVLGHCIMAAHPDHPLMMRCPKPDGDLGPWEEVRHVEALATLKIPSSLDWACIIGASTSG